MYQRLFIGLMPCGVSYADRETEEDGDYKKIASLPYGTLAFEVHDANSPLIEEARRDAAKIQARKGQLMTVAQTGQTVMLGGKA